jgi:molecular chaperone DnaK
VTFDIDANGIINVNARDRATGKEQKVTITASTNLSKNDIENMIHHAREHEAEDRRHKELIEARNLADNIVYQTEKALKELGEKVPEGEQQNIQAKINSLQQEMTGEDTAKIKRLVDELQNAFHALSQQLYAQQGQQTTGFSSSGNGNGHQSRPDDEGEVVEGEFREA